MPFLSISCQKTNLLTIRKTLQDGLNERLYVSISNFPLYSYYYDRISGGEMLKYYSLFSDAFTEEQQESLEKLIFDAIMKDATHSNKEKEYYGIKYGIEKLSKVRPECHAKEVTLRDNLIRQYPRKLLFLSILKQLDLSQRHNGECPSPLGGTPPHLGESKSLNFTYLY